ncbi:MAG TPA: TMEM14 family protein [Candidatus Melainabacteria bacterium]|nr:TMEM14 family protein [Candidatus Melainabacteria bacterium]
MHEIAQYAIPVYAVLMLLGGIMGFVKGKSKASLIAGGGSALALFGCFAYSFSDLKMAVGGAFALALLLEAVFAMRLAKTKKFMPSGVLLILSGVFQVIFILAII